MADSRVNHAYEVALGPAALRTILSMPKRAERKRLADVLGKELLDGPNADREYRFNVDAPAYAGRGANPDSRTYTATPLSFKGCTAVHRPLTSDEIGRLRAEEGPSTAEQGFYVVDILFAESGFTRTVPRPV